MGIKHPKFQNPLYTRIWNNVHIKNKNCLIIISGATGSGKSWLACRIGESLDPEFKKNVEQRVITHPNEFMDLIENGNLKKGSVIILDEAGVGLPAREWYSFNNRAINYILQTFRYKNLIVIFTTPSFDYIDKQARILFRYYIETLDIDFAQNKTLCKIFELQYNPILGRLYKKYPRFKINGKYIKFKRITFNKACKETLKQYEKKALKLKDKLAHDIHDAVKEIEHEREKKKPIDVRVIAEEIWKKREAYEVERAGKLHFDADLIHLDYPNMSFRQVMQAKKLAEKNFQEENEN